MTSRRSFLGSVAAYGSGAILLDAGPAAGSKTDLTKLTLLEAGNMVRRKSVSPVELTQACLARIERLNPVLNAFITVTADQALEQAKEAEKEIAKGKWKGPLHGVPIGLKDLLDTAGVRTTAASGVFEHRVPEQDAEVVRRLKTAGAVLIGKLNMHEFAYGGTSTVSFFGPVHNPWNPDYITGGSSGGSAAAVAAGLCYAAIGSDTGGSIREPSSYCGITGLKPTYGRVSTRGAVPLSWSLDHLGPMTHTVMDAAILLQAIAGYDPEEITSIDIPVPDYVAGTARNGPMPRLGILRKNFFSSLHPDVEAAVNQAISVLAKFSAGVREVEPLAVDRAAGVVLRTEAYAYHLPYVTKTPELYQPDTLRRVRAGEAVTAADYLAGRRALETARRNVRTMFTDVDLLITPTSPVPPGQIGKPDPQENARLRNTSPFDTYGLPAISIPCGFTKEGLPIGLQIAGPPWAEIPVLELARMYESATDWHKRTPKLLTA